MRYIEELIKNLKKLPQNWDGKKCILELKENNDKNWKQMEWIGWYFEYWCKNNLGMMNGRKFGHSKFDAYFQGIDYDFKAHPIYDKLGKKNFRLITNDKEAIISSIKQNGETGLIVAMGICIFDTDGLFKKWHDTLKGEISDYEKTRVKEGRSSRVRKTSFIVKQVNVYSITESTLQNSISFQKGMRNSDGSPRREKVMLNLDVEQPIYIIKFD